MKLWPFAFTLALLSVLPVSAREWLDEFDKEDLNKEWFRITDRPVEQGSVTIEDGKLLINDPNIVEYFSLEGEDVIPMAVGPAGKLTDTWGRIKLLY